MKHCSAGRYIQDIRMPPFLRACARFPALVTHTPLWGRSHDFQPTLASTQKKTVNMAVRGQQTPAVSHSDGSSTCPPPRPSLAVTSPASDLLGGSPLQYRIEARDDHRKRCRHEIRRRLEIWYGHGQPRVVPVSCGAQLSPKSAFGRLARGTCIILLRLSSNSRVGTNSVSKRANSGSHSSLMVDDMLSTSMILRM